MITRITKENRAKYVQFFAKASEALNLPQNITTFEEYFQNIVSLRNLDPSFIRVPLDEEMFDIDLNTRQINVPVSFKKNGIGIQGDHLAEVVYFKVDRYFETTDLATTFIVIQWETPDGKKMASPAYTKDVTSEKDKIIFGWGITKTMTERQGNLKFSVAFLEGEKIDESLDSDIEKLNIEDLSYRLGTLTATVGINATLDIYSNKKVVFENASSALDSRIHNSPIPGATVAEKPIILENTKYFDWKEKTIFADIRKNLLTLPDKEVEGRVDNGLNLIAVSPENGAGLINYEFYEVGQNDPIRQGVGAFKYVKVNYPEKDENGKSNKIDAPIYFIDKTGLQESWRYFEEGVDKWQYDDGTINPYLYERIAFCPIEKPGEYYVKVLYTEGRAVSELNTKDKGVTAIIPGPTEIDKVSINLSSEIYEGNPVAINSNVVLKVEENLDSYGEYKYQWCERNYQSNGEFVDTPIEGADDSEYLAKKIGDYVLYVSNWWNNVETDKVISNNVKIYLAAEKPEEVKIIAKVPAGSDTEKGAKISVVGNELEVTFKNINQEQAVQYVEWQISDKDEDITDADWEWVYKLDENGEPTEEHYRGTNLVPLKPGDYRAIVYNYITDGNNQETVTTEYITEENPTWEDRIVRVFGD